jgi:hypothetical protein
MKANVPAQSVFACKLRVTFVASEALDLPVDTVLVTLQVRLSHKLLITVFERANMLLLTARVVRFEVCLVVVGPLKQFAAVVAFVLRVFFGGGITTNP